MTDPVQADANLADADWPKATWDFPDMTLDDWRATPRPTLEALITLPVFQAAPEDVREVILGRLGNPS